VPSITQSQTPPCTICNANSVVFGTVDFNKNFLDPLLRKTPPSGMPVTYHRCMECALIFTPDFDSWTKQTFNEKIYNQDYINFDPDYLDARPATSAEVMMQFAERLRPKTILDYGGGNGRMAEILRSHKLYARSFDPMHGGTFPTEKYDLISAIEVFEHTPTPRQTFQEITTLLNPAGILVFSTLCVGDVVIDGMHHPYIAPRNGHVTIHSRQSLDVMAAQFGFVVNHIDDLLHVATRNENSDIFRQLGI
jgi:SAM-dependent methyltransferase